MKPAATGAGVLSSKQKWHPSRPLPARLRSSVALSEPTKHLEFEVMGTSHFGFVQVSGLSLKHDKPDGEEITRAYSIASSPTVPPSEA